MRGRAVQAGLGGEDFETHWFRIAGNSVQQAGHAVDDLNSTFLSHNDFILRKRLLIVAS